MLRIAGSSSSPPRRPCCPVTAVVGLRHGVSTGSTDVATGSAVAAPSVLGDDPADRARHPAHHRPSSFGSLGFGSGYAAAETSICTLADTLLTARGQRSRWFGPDARYNDQVTLEASNLQVDAFVTDLHNRQVVEKLLADHDRGPAQQARQMVDGYVAGVNRYLDDVGPERRHRPRLPGRGVPASRRRARSTSGTASTSPTCSPRAGSSSRRSSTPTRRRRTTRASPNPHRQRGRPGRAAAPGWAATPRRRSAPTRPRSAATRRRPARACCSATRTSRGAAATASPSST